MYFFCKILILFVKAFYPVLRCIQIQFYSICNKDKDKAILSVDKRSNYLGGASISCFLDLDHMNNFCAKSLENLLNSGESHERINKDSHGLEISDLIRLLKYIYSYSKR